MSSALRVSEALLARSQVGLGRPHRAKRAPENLGMILFDKKLPVTSAAFKGYEKTVAKYNTDSDPSTVSLRELDRAHGKLEARYRDVESWGPQDSPAWQARYEAAGIENLEEQIRLANRSPVDKAVGTVIGTALLALGWYPH